MKMKVILLFVLLTISFANKKPACQAKFEYRTNTEWNAVFWKKEFTLYMNQTTLYYNLTVKDARLCGSNACKDLSHWVLGFCNSTETKEQLIIGGSQNQTQLSMCDPTTGMYGYKFDKGQKSGTTVTYSVILRGNWDVSPGKYAVKGGTYYEIKDILVPCKVPEVPPPVKPENCEEELPYIVDGIKKKLDTYNCQISTFNVNDTCFAGECLLKFEQKKTTEWNVKFVDVVYDPVTDLTTYTYNLTAQCPQECINSTGDSCKDLSHWVLGLSSCSFNNKEFLDLNPGSALTYGCDPTTGCIGLKWDGGQKACSSEIYKVTTKGMSNIGITYYTVKGGTYFSSHPVIGPVDKGLSCEVQRTYLKYMTENICPEQNVVSSSTSSCFSIFIFSLTLLILL